MRVSHSLLSSFPIAIVCSYVGLILQYRLSHWITVYTAENTHTIFYCVTAPI